MLTSGNARLNQLTGKVKIAKKLVDFVPARLFYATVQYTPEGNYVAFLSALPNADAIPFFQEREMAVNGKGEGVITLGDLCEDAGISGDLECLYDTKPKRWDGVPHVLELWDPHSLQKHIENQLLEEPATNAPRCIWTYTPKSF